MKLITRTVESTVVTFTRVTKKNGLPEIGEIEKAHFFDSKISSEEDCVKAIRKAKILGANEPFFVVEFETTSDVYGMPVEKFMSMGEKVDRPASQKKNG